MNPLAGNPPPETTTAGAAVPGVVAMDAREVALLRRRVAELEAVLIAFIQTSEAGIAAKIIDGAPSLEPFRQYLRAKP